MELQRLDYLNALIKKKDNGAIKIITGIRRCGKSTLLFRLFRKHLQDQGIAASNIVEIQLDELQNARLRNPFELDAYIRNRIALNKERFYVLIDEIQFVEEVANPYLENGAPLGFVDVVLGLMKLENIDLYITGSNSRMLSSDILTQFKDRGDEIRVFPLSYQEFYDAYPNKAKCWHEFLHYGGMPRLISLDSHEAKSKYLKDLISKTYISDVIERNKIRNDRDTLDDLLNILASAIGSLTNPSKLSRTFRSLKATTITANTIANYLDYFEDAFVIAKANRYDVKGKRYMSTPLKIYFTDIGLRNAHLNFRQQEENHIMENIIFNELMIRQYNVDVGVVEINYKDETKTSKRKQLEVDFIATKFNRKYYIQSALTISPEEKRNQEISSLLRIDDSFKKIVVVKDAIIPWHDEHGILYLGIEQFLLEKDAIDL